MARYKERLPHTDASRWNRVTATVLGRRARYAYIITLGLLGGSALGAVVDADLWVRIVMGVLVGLIGVQMQQVYYLSNIVADIHPQSPVTREMMEMQGQSFRRFADEALVKTETRLLEIVKTLPGLFSLAMEPSLQRHLLKIGEMTRSSSRQAANVIHRMIAIGLERTAKDEEQVSKTTLVIRNEPEIADPRWRAILEVAGDDRHAVATSWVLPEWWERNKAWRDENEEVLKRGIRLARVFIVEDEKELLASIPVMREQSKQGVQVNWVHADVLRERALEPRDILVSNCDIPGFENPDNSQKQLRGGAAFGEQILEASEAQSGYRLLSRRVELSAYPLEVAKAREVIQNIYRLSDRFYDTEWWSYFFDDHYVHITSYKEATTEQETEMLIKATGLTEGMRVLDLGCAYGRIEEILGDKVGRLEVIPVDCSQKLLNEAMARATHVFAPKGAAALDMRNIAHSYSEDFDLVMSTFTSWGYFREDENQAMFESVSRVLRPGGVFYLDVDNPSFVRSNNELTEYESDGHIIRRWDYVKDCKEKNSEGETVAVPRRLSQFLVVESSGRVRSKPLVSLRLYELNELQTVAARAGFDFVQAYDESGLQWGSSRSQRREQQIPERIIVVLRKRAR